MPDSLSIGIKWSIEVEYFDANKNDLQCNILALQTFYICIFKVYDPYSHVFVLQPLITDFIVFMATNVLLSAQYD